LDPGFFDHHVVRGLFHSNSFFFVVLVGREPIDEARRACSKPAGQKLAYAYYEEEPGRRSTAKMLTKDEAGGLPPCDGCHI
jgi:hypothetical protein